MVQDFCGGDMELRKLSNADLHHSFKKAVHGENEALKNVLLHVIEVDRRKSYFDFNCSSLFAYMTEVMGYSNGAAQRRIDAARLSYDVPELVETIEAGGLNLDQVRLVQQSIRQVAKETHQIISPAMKLQVVNEIVGKTLAESEVIVAQSLDVQIKTATKVQHQADESIRLEVSFSKAQWAKLEEMRTLLSHSLPSGSWDDVFEYVADKVIQQKSKMIERRKYSKKSSAAADRIKLQESNSGQAKDNETRDREHIPAEIVRQVFQRDVCCKHKSPNAEKECSSKWMLQVDHIVPIWAGGDNSFENLQLLCAIHNQAKYKKEANIRSVR